ncbi:hypothetical protein K488DRAFT_83663 [Vararia minispora EC-137]|uniref:Uncharacterized protein n=1 Tax=Vararia minispora EC-137 TaxID=1314806 RepID=A0ACB8QTJ3_9AGAM|nr:hypothetical protein K488DRAFT_83663 [Vararia minispora EC-137]
MSDDPAGLCCFICLTACYDVCAGVCLDFISIRHTFTQCFWPYREELEEERADEERRPLIAPDSKSADSGARDARVLSQPGQTSDMSVGRN